MNEDVLSEGWVMAFKNGEEFAFKLFYDETISRLTAFIYKMQAEDIYWELEEAISESYYRVFRFRDRYENFDHARKALFTICKNLRTDVYKRRQEIKKVRLSIDLLEFEDKESLDRRIYLERRKTLLALLNKLPKQRRKIIELTFLGVSTAKIAQKLKLSTQTVNNHRTRAINDLMLMIHGKIIDKGSHILIK